ncbi:MAG: hypothetical protein MZV63_32935 [Marinilabiliales bacterium]|nr:hypothetical protein [Marinilabiliales bacterium]
MLWGWVGILIILCRHRHGVVSVPEVWKEVAVAGNIIEIKGLTGRYGQFTAVDNLDLTDQ